MNIMNQLTGKHMKTNKKRTLMTILGVIISVAMITAVSTATVSFLDLLQRMAMDNEGAWHVQYNRLPVDEMSTLEKEENVKKIFYTKSLAYGKFVDTESKNASKPYLYIVQYTPDSMKQMSLKLTMGRFPANKNEIVLPEHLRANGGITYGVGDTITLELGDRFIDEYTDNNILNQKNPYKENELEEFHVKETKTFQVVGIIKRPDFEKFSAPGFTAITYLDMNSLSKNEKVTANVFEKNITKKIYDQGYKTASKLGVVESNVQFNEAVLRYYGLSQYDSFNQMITGLSFILILIIMIGSVSLIYNSFAISITERSKQFGMLASVGATRQQKRNAIFYEGAVIGGIAIPLGIIAGIVGMAITFNIVGPMLTYSVDINVPLKIHVSLSSIIVSVIFSALTIFISALIPAKRASRISAIDAIRQTNDIKLQKKVVKTSKFTRILFSIEGELAQKNLKRNKKRYRALVFSLFISLVLFISVGSYVFYLSKSIIMTTEDSNYDITIYFNENIPSDDVLDALRQIEGVIEGTKLASSPLTMVLDENFVEANITKHYIETKKEHFRNWGWSEEEIEQHMNEYGYSLYIDLVTLDDISYTKYLNQLGVTRLDAKTNQANEQIQGILINKHKEQLGYKLMEADVLQIKPKDKFSIYYQNYDEVVGDDGDLYYEASDRIEIQLPLIAVTDRLPMGLEYSSMNGAMRIVISEDTHQKLIDRFAEEIDANINASYYFKVDRPEGIDERLEHVMKEFGVSSFNIINRYEQTKQDEQLMTVMSIFAYGFIVLISLICMTNLCNTIATSFALRRREFAMLKSVGMEPKAFHRMIRFESLLYGVRALLYGLPVSLLITYKIYQVVNSNFMSKFTFPWVTYMVGIVSVFLVVGVAMVYSTYKVKDESIITGLKSEIE
jgi:putative ABC transport system permease protein